MKRRNAMAEFMISDQQRNELWQIWNEQQEDRTEKERDEASRSSSGRDDEARQEAQRDEAGGGAGAATAVERHGGGADPRDTPVTPESNAMADCMITDQQRNELRKIWNGKDPCDTQETRETSRSSSPATLRDTAAGAVAASSEAAAVDSEQARVDEIIALKLLVANQQATIDTLSSKFHNLECAHRRLLGGCVGTVGRVPRAA